MSSHTAQTIPTTNAGTASSSQKERTPQTQNEIALSQNLVSKEHVETLTEFQAKVDAAKMEGPDEDDDLIWVETSPAICKYYVRAGLGKSEYFEYQGVKVCETGKKAQLKERLAQQLGALVHGDASVQQVTATKKMGPK